MKLSKTTFAAIASAALLFASCSKDDSTAANQNLAPVPAITGAIGQLVEANPTAKPMAGVIEEYPDYANGELFYWHNNDKVKVLFFKDGDLTQSPVEIVYTAIVADGLKPDVCNFTASGNLPVGSYSAYALYPAGGWEKEGNTYVAKSSPAIYQADISSTPLKEHMFMKAVTKNVTVTAEGTSPIGLSFKHLSSVIRFHITSKATVSSMSTDYISLMERFGSDLFHTEAYLLSTDLDNTALSPKTSTQLSQIILRAGTDLPFTKRGDSWELDIFLPVFPTIDVSGKLLKIESYITINGNSTYQQLFDTYNGLSFPNDLNLPNGFEAGKSYYFNLIPFFG